MWLQQLGISHIKALGIFNLKSFYSLVNRTHKGFVPENYQRPYSTLNVSCFDNCIYGTPKNQMSDGGYIYIYIYIIYIYLYIYIYIYVLYISNIYIYIYHTSCIYLNIWSKKRKWINGSFNFWRMKQKHF